MASPPSFTPPPKDITRAQRQARSTPGGGARKGGTAADGARHVSIGQRASPPVKMQAEAGEEATGEEAAAEEAALKGTALVYAPTTLREQLPGLMRMARLNAIPMGAALVGFGAYGARRVAGAVATSHRAAKLLLGMVLTCIVTAGSMLINDYHDHKLGVDNARTKPGRPLVTGEVQPEAVKLVLKWGYATHLTLLCLVETAPMRLWVLGNTLLTYLYSVHLKPLTGVKNLVCALIVAMAVGLGALAVDGSLAALAAVWRPMVAVSGLIWHREMVMDIKDMEGDSLAGVRTVPVAFGSERALLLSLLPLVGSAAAAATARTRTAALAATLPLLLQGGLAVRAMRARFARPRMVAAIELAPLWLATTLVALTL